MFFSSSVQNKLASLCCLISCLVTCFILASLIPSQTYAAGNNVQNNALANLKNKRAEKMDSNFWRFKYQVTSRSMSGLLAGSDGVVPLSVLQNSQYKKLPYAGSHDCTLSTDPCLMTTVSESMRIDRHAFNIEYQHSEDLSLMFNLAYLSKTLHMIDQISSNVPAAPFQLGSKGLSDVEILIRNRLSKSDALDVDLTLGLSLPTGSIDKSDGIRDMTGQFATAPYIMQLGSGTYDLIMNLALSGAYQRIGYGSSIYRISRTGLNSQYYNLGDELKLKGWGSFTFPHGTKFRAALTQNVWSPITGRDQRISNNTLYTGGKRLEASIGVGQKFKQMEAHLDYAHPLLQYLNGVQLKTTGTISLGVEFRTK